MKKLRLWLSALIMMGLTGLAFGEPVDINTADAATIAKAMGGVGAKKSEAIVTYRQQNGPFASIDDLTKVKGISKKIIESNRTNIAVSAKSVAPAVAKPETPAASTVPPAKPK